MRDSVVTTTVSASDTSSGNASGGSTGDGTYTRTFDGGTTGGTAHSDQTQSAGYNSTVSMSGNALAPTFSGTSSQNASGSTNDSYVGLGNYVVSPAVGGVTSGPVSTGGGTINESGGDHTDFNIVSQSSLGAYGLWTPTSGNNTQNASANSHSTNNGNGYYTNVYANGGSNGTWTQNGGSDTNYHTQTVANVAANGNWITTGSSTHGGDDNQNSTYTGGGAFTIGGYGGLVTSGPTSSGGGTTTESGADHSADNYTSLYSLNANGGWDPVSGSDSTSDKGETHSTFNANGGYTNNSVSGTDGGTWTQTGGSDNFYNTQTASALNTAGYWMTTGTSAKNGDDNQNSTYTGGGAYTVGGTSSLVMSGSSSSGSGTTTESGADHYSDLYSTLSVLGANGWTTPSGNGTASDIGDTHSTYTSNGVYTNNYVGGTDGGTWTQDGGSDTNYNTQTVSTIGSTGNWVTTGTSDAGGGDSQNSTYTGGGAYIASNGVNSVGVGTTTESGADNYSDLYTTHSVLGSSGNWTTVSGDGTSSDIGNTHSTSTGVGVYINNSAGGTDGGTYTENGGSDTNSNTQTVSAIGPNGNWVTTGTSDAGGDDNQNSSYQGGGAYTVGVAGDATTGAGTTTESGADHYSDLYTTHSVLAANGVWTTVSGSGTASDVGATSSAYTANGVYTDNYTGGTDGGTWNQSGGSDTNYNTQTVSTLGSAGYWTTTGTSTVGGDDNENDSHTGAGAYTVASVGSTGVNFTGGGATTETGSDNYSDNYTSQYTLDANGNWDAVSGSGSSNGGGSTGSTYSGSGAYTNLIAGGDITGTWTESGGDNTYYTTQTVSSLDSSGNWTTTGATDAGGGGNWGSSYNGSGNYVNPPSNGPSGVVSGTSGTIMESGAHNGSYAFDDPYTLSNGYWQSAGGSAAAHDAGFDERSDTGTGLITGDHFASDAAFSLNPGGNWALTNFSNGDAPFTLPLGSANAGAITAAIATSAAPTAGTAASDAATLAASNLLFSAAASGASLTQTAATGASGAAATALGGRAAGVVGLVGVAAGGLGALKVPLGFAGPALGPPASVVVGPVGGFGARPNPFFIHVGIGILEGELPIVYQLIANPPPPTTTDERLGRFAGHLIVLAQGLLEMGAGDVGMVGGAISTPPTMGGGLVLVAVGAVVEVHGAVVTGAALGYIITIDVGGVIIAAMSATPPPGGTPTGSGAAGNPGGSYPGAKELAKRLGVSENEFHRVVKPQILKQLGKEAKSIGATNPDVGVNQAGNIVLRNPQTKVEITTDLPLSTFAPE